MAVARKAGLGRLRRASEPPNEVPQKSYQKILEQETATGLKELERTSTGLLMSGFSAGLDLTFSLFLAAVMVSLINGQLPRPISAILVASMHTVGFIFVVLGRSELFTEHTTRAVYPVLTGHARVTSLFRLWSLVYVANLVGTAVFSKIATVIGPRLGIIDRHAFAELAAGSSGQVWWVLMTSGILAGWLMGLLSWLVTAARDTISQVVLVYLITFAIALCRLDHAVLGSGHLLAAYFSGTGVSMRTFVFFLVWSTIGNAIGGVFFVAILKYGHVVRGGAERSDVSLDQPSRS